MQSNTEISSWAKERIEKGQYSEAFNFLIQTLKKKHNNQVELLKLAYESAKKLGNYYKALKILNEITALKFSDSHEITDCWIKEEKRFCLKKIRHGNADTFLFLGVAFSAFYITARSGLNYRNEIFILLAALFYLVGFALRKFYLWDK